MIVLLSAVFMSMNIAMYIYIVWYALDLCSDHFNVYATLGCAVGIILFLNISSNYGILISFMIRYFLVGIVYYLRGLSSIPQGYTSQTATSYMFTWPYIVGMNYFPQQTQFIKEYALRAYKMIRHGS